MSYSLNSRLGVKHLACLYSLLQHDSSCLVTLAAAEEKILGIVSAVSDPRRFKQKVFSSMPFSSWVEIAKQPALWLDAWRDRALDHPLVYKKIEIKPMLTAIAVDEAARQSGIGRALVQAVDDFFRRQSQPFYYLDTRVDNASARALYQRLGFIEHERRGRNLILVKEL